MSTADIQDIRNMSLCCYLRRKAQVWHICRYFFIYSLCFIFLSIKLTLKPWKYVVLSSRGHLSSLLRSPRTKVTGVMGGSWQGVFQVNKKDGREEHGKNLQWYSWILHRSLHRSILVELLQRLKKLLFPQLCSCTLRAMTIQYVPAVLLLWELINIMGSV